ncbi:hypothetical protein QSH57_004634 [Fusarium oxysporum f. sp. vasinfectum]|nr:hypothetical protein QSH57_004634 [Fusarium oxysporum f. sp. vasinfectum]
MISFVESRKPADDHEPSNRQSLPPVPEAIQGTKPGPYPPFTNRPLPSPVSDRRQRFSAKPEILTQHRRPEQQKPPELHHPLNGVHAHSPPPLPPPAPAAYQPGQLSPRQMPLPTCMSYPRHAVPPHVLGLCDPRALPHGEEADYATRALYDATVKIYFENWSYQDSLSRIGSSSRMIFNFVEAYSRIADEQHGAHLIPERLPTGHEVSDMLSNIDIIKRSLEQVRDLVQTSIQNERTCEEARLKGPNEEEHDVPRYRDAMKPSMA